MTSKGKDRWLERQEEVLVARNTGASDPHLGDTPHAQLLRAARTGRYEALVAKARPAQAARMVTPEERETALRDAGQWPAEKTAPPEKASEEMPAPEPTQKLTPNEAFIAENCRWVPSHERDYWWAKSTYGRCIVNYDPLTGEIIGDGYVRYGDDDEW